VAGGVWMATRGSVRPGPALGRAHAGPAGIRRLWPKNQINLTMPRASGRKRPTPCETYHDNNRRRPTDHSPITPDDH
jgi:hypothetical protein